MISINMIWFINYFSCFLNEKYASDMSTKAAIDVITNSDTLLISIVLLALMKLGNNIAKPIDRIRITRSSTIYFMNFYFSLTQM